MSNASRPRKAHEDYTVAVVFAMSVEMWAFRYMLDQLHARLDKPDNDPNDYHLGEVCNHNVVLVCLPGEQGNSQAARVGTNLSNAFPNIKWRLLVGVGGGVWTEKHRIRLGDVAISMPSGAYGGVGRYDQGRDLNGEFQFKGIIHDPPEGLRAIVEGMKGDIRGEESRMREYLDTMLNSDPDIAEKYQRPLDETDLLFPDDVDHTAGYNKSCHSGCDATKAIAHAPRKDEGQPKVWYGLIASGNSVMANTTSRAEKIARLNADVLCFETEAAGFMTAFPCLVIRGISDYADSHKHQEWQPYAAAVAAACAKDVLARVQPLGRSSGVEKAANGFGRYVPRLDDDSDDEEDPSPPRGRITYHVGQGNIIRDGDWAGNMTFNNTYR